LALRCFSAAAHKQLQQLEIGASINSSYVYMLHIYMSTVIMYGPLACVATVVRVEGRRDDRQIVEGFLQSV